MTDKKSLYPEDFVAIPKILDKSFIEMLQLPPELQNRDMLIVMIEKIYAAIVQQLGDKAGYDLAFHIGKANIDDILHSRTLTKLRRVEKDNAALLINIKFLQDNLQAYKDQLEAEANKKG